MTIENEVKTRRERSPSYPAIPLAVAVERTRELYRKERGYAAPIPTILNHWGYQPRSGGGLVAIAAVLKFGLMEDEGSAATRKAKVSELGQRLVRDTREDSPDRLRLLQTAALKPQIHRELWDKYGGSLPSDSNLEYTLKMEYGFTDLGAKEFLKQFRSTIAYANLEEGDEEGSADSAYNPSADEPMEISAPPPPVLTGARGPVAPARFYGGSPGISLPLPIAASIDRWPTLYLPMRLTVAEFESMKTMLDAMKVGIVEEVAGAGAAQGTGAAHDATVKVDEPPASD